MFLFCSICWAIFVGMKRRKRIDLSKMLNSPFGVDTPISVSKIVYGNNYVVGDDGISIPKAILFDKAKRVSFFQSRDNEDVLSMLGGVGLMLFVHIMCQMEKGEDWVYINRALFFSKYGIKSRTTYLAALAKLFRYDILRVTDYKDYYWVNPNFLFGGDRAKKYPNSVKTLNEYFISGKIKK